jgi:hypothetical protein
MVPGRSFVRYRCVAGGLGGLWLIFSTFLRQMKKEENQEGSCFLYKPALLLV